MLSAPFCAGRVDTLIPFSPLHGEAEQAQTGWRAAAQGTTWPLAQASRQALEARSPLPPLGAIKKRKPTSVGSAYTTRSS